jgi:hypothetical protein
MLKVNFALLPTIKPQIEGRHVALPFCEPRPEMAVGGQRKTRPLYPRERFPAPMEQEIV